MAEVAGQRRWEAKKVEAEVMRKSIDGGPLYI